VDESEKGEKMTFRSRLTNVVKRVQLGVSAAIGGQSFVQKQLTKALYRMGYGSKRAPAYAGRTIPPGKIVEPQWDYKILYREAQTHHILRRIHEAIIRECTRVGGTVEPRFLSKCKKCGTEYMKELDRCESEECGGVTVKPDPTQRSMLQDFIKNPNRDNEWLQLLTSLLRFELAVDDWYLLVEQQKATLDLKPFGTAEKLDTNVLTVRVLDSRYMRVCADDYGNLGNEEFFCPGCYDGIKGDKSFDLNYYKTHGGKCPDCAGELIETVYIWREAESSTIKGRFGRDEVIHSNMCSQLPHIYGVPKTIAALRPLHILRHMARFNLENYGRGKVDKLIIISGMSQDDVNQMRKDITQQAEEHVERSLVTGQRGAPKLHVPWIGLEHEKASVTVVDAMPDSEKMQSIEWYKQHAEDVCSIWGVTPKFEGIAEAGKQGLRMVIDVDNNVTRSYQKSLTDVFDEELWPKFLGVTDWVWRFGEIEERDVKLDAETKEINVRTAIAAANAKMNVELEETGNLKVSGKPQPREPFEMPFQEKPSGERSEEEKVWAKPKSKKKRKGFLVYEV